MQTGPTEFSVCWETVVGAEYRIESSDDLVTFTQVGANINALRDETALAVPAPGPRLFWRAVRLDITE